MEWSGIEWSELRYYAKIIVYMYIYLTTKEI